MNYKRKHFDYVSDFYQSCIESCIFSFQFANLFKSYSSRNKKWQFLLEHCNRANCWHGQSWSQVKILDLLLCGITCSQRQKRCPRSLTESTPLKYAEQLAAATPPLPGSWDLRYTMQEVDSSSSMVHHDGGAPTPEIQVSPRMKAKISGCRCRSGDPEIKVSKSRHAAAPRRLEQWCTSSWNPNFTTREIWNPSFTMLEIQASPSRLLQCWCCTSSWKSPYTMHEIWNLSFAMHKIKAFCSSSRLQCCTSSWNPSFAMREIQASPIRLLQWCSSSWNPGPQRLGLGSSGATAVHQCNFPPDEFDQRFKT